MPEYDVVGMGNVLLDLVVEVDDEFLEQINIPKGSYRGVDEKEFEKIIKKIEELKPEKHSGGSTANVMIGVSRLGGKSLFIGRVGDDEHGDLYHKLVTQAGVKVKLEKDKMKTGVAITFVTPDYERSFAVFLGAALTLTVEDIEEEIILNSKILHIEGYLLEAPNLKETALKAMRIAKKQGVLISIDLADPYFIKKNHEFMKKIVKEYADIVFVNEAEAEAFTGLKEEEALHKIHEDCKVAVVKLGKKGSLIKAEGEVHKIPINKVKEVNTTGAGDAYAAGLLYAIAKKIPIKKAGLIAAFISSRVVASQSASAQEDLREDVKRIAGKHV